jgi:hypothetical protein
MVPSMSVCRDFLETRQPTWLQVIIGPHCCNSGNQNHYWKTFLQQGAEIAVENITTMGTEVVGIHCCKNGNRCYCWLIVPSDHIVKITLDKSVEFVRFSSKFEVILSRGCRRNNPLISLSWFGAKEIFGISLHSEEYTFKMLLLLLLSSLL